MSQRPTRDIASIIREGSAIDRAMAAAQRRVVLRHRLLGIPLVIWRDGRVVEVPAESLDLAANADDPRTDES